MYVFVVETVVICVRGACKDRQLLFDFCSTSDYVTIGFVFLLEFGFIKG